MPKRPVNRVFPLWKANIPITSVAVDGKVPPSLGDRDDIAVGKSPKLGRDSTL